MVISLVCMMILSSVSVFAEEDISIQQLINADPTRNISSEELLIPNGIVPDFDEDEIITENTLVLETTGTKSTGGSGSNKMTAYQYSQIEDVATKGNVIITKDNTTLGIQHGHRKYRNRTQNHQYGELIKTVQEKHLYIIMQEHLFHRIWLNGGE